MRRWIILGVTALLVLTAVLIVADATEIGPVLVILTRGMASTWGISSAR